MAENLNVFGERTICIGYPKEQRSQLLISACDLLAFGWPSVVCYSLKQEEILSLEAHLSSLAYQRTFNL